MATRSERKDASRLERRQADRSEAAHPEPDPTRGAKRRGKTPKTHRFGVEYRVAPGRVSWARREEWAQWRWYATEARRDAAMAAMGRSDLFEYRPTER